MRTLTGTALICRALGWYPLWLLMLCVSAPTGQTLLLCCGMLFAAALISALWHRFLRIRYPAFTAGAVIAELALLLPAAGAACFGIFQRTGRIFTAAALAAVTVFGTAFGAHADPDTLYSRGRFAASLTGAVIAPVMLLAAAVPIPMRLLLSLTAVLTCCCLLLRNQAMLHRLVHRRADGLGEVPAEIRRYNLRLVAGLILLLGLCFLLHRPIISLITGIGRGLRMLIRALFALITKLIAWLGGNAPEELPPAEGGVPGGDAPLPADSNPLWNLLWIPVLLLFIYILRPLLSELADSIREILMRISAKLHSRGGTVREIIPESGEFTDTETVSLPEEHAESRRAGRKWNKAVRAWERLPDNAEKFYAGYRLLMQAPAWETRPAAADTALEICEKWKQQSGSGLTPVTDALHAERYAAQGLPDDAIRDMKQALAMLGNAAEKARRNDAGDAPRKGQ